MGLYEERIVPYPWQGEHEDDEKYAAIVREYENERLLKSFDNKDFRAVASRKHEVIRKEILKRMAMTEPKEEVK